MPYNNGKKVYNKGRDSRREFVCLVCSLNFKSYVKRKYCSEKCYQISEKTTRIGKGNPMFGKEWSLKRKSEPVSWKGKMPKNINIFIEGGKKYHKLNPRKGDKNNFWKGGITPINKLIRQSKKYKDWRNKVYKRDYWTCKICNKHCQKTEIVAHHIKPFSDYPKLRFIVKNGMVLCRGCHVKLHKPQKRLLD